MASTNYEILVAPSVEPLSLLDVKTYLRVDYSDEDTLIQQFISDARRFAEDLLKRSLAVQTIRATLEPDRILESSLSGPISGGYDIYRMNERVTTVPFAFYGPSFILPRTPVSAISVVEYQLLPYDVPEWTLLPATDGNGNINYRLDTNVDPARIYLMPMLVASRYRFTYTAGYAPGTVPFDILNAMKSLISFWYDNRQGQAVPDSIINALVRRRVWEL